MNDGESVGNNTWYHVHLLFSPTTGVVDAGFDTSVTAANLLADAAAVTAGMTKYRRVGAVRTDGSANIIDFVQLGDDFYWKDPPEDYDSANPGTNEVTEALGYVPLGVSVIAKLHVYHTGVGFYAHHPDVNDEAPSTTDPPGASSYSAGSAHMGLIEVATNASAQIQFRLASDAQANIHVIGWKDRRGRDD